MTAHAIIHDPVPLLDIQDNGMGDVVLACWIVESALAQGLPVQVNPRRWPDLPKLLGMPACAVTRRVGASATGTPGLGLRFEYRSVATDLAEGREPQNRFTLWAASLGLCPPGRPVLVPVRPRYCEDLSDRDWAGEQWRKGDEAEIAPRVLLFTDCARDLRRWSGDRFAELAGRLREDGWNVAAMAGKRAAVETLGCRYWYGFSMGRVAAMIAQADLVIAGDTGPAHLAGTIGTPTLALCGPTIGSVVFGHDPNVLPLHGQGEAVPPCAPCHFSKARGYGESCSAHGCGALAALTPLSVRDAARARIAEILARPASARAERALGHMNRPQA